MATAASRALRAFVLVVCAALMVSFSPSSSVSASSCAELLAWAQPLAGTAPTLDDMGRYDRAHRRALFSVLTPAVQAALWREQIASYGRRAERSPQQRARAMEAMTLLTPALYRHEPAARRAFDAFWTRASAAFGDAASQRAWSDLGGLASTSAPVHATETDCNCKVGGGTGQCGGVSCGRGSCALVSGCGVSGLQTCDGLCQS